MTQTDQLTSYPATFTADTTAAGEPAGFVVTFRDIPEAKHGH